MKAIEILEWICRESINGEDLNIIEVPEEGESSWEQNEEWWNNYFGACPPHSVSAGKYLYYYESSLGIEWIVTRLGKQEPDATIEVGYNDAKECWDYIHLYKLED